MSVTPEKCPKCSAPLANDAKFCSECGEKILHPSTIVCPGCNNVISKSKFCPNCGYDIEHNFYFVSPEHRELSSLPQTSPVETKNITSSEQSDQFFSLPPNKESDQNCVAIENIKSNATNPTKNFAKSIIISAALIIAFFIGIIAIMPAIIKTSEHPESYTTSINCVHSYNFDGYCFFCENYDQAFDIETECPHVYGNDGYCFLCQNYDESFKLDPYDLLKQFILEHGRSGSSNKHQVSYVIYSSDYTISVIYDKAQNCFLLTCLNNLQNISAFFNMFFDRTSNCTYSCLSESNGETLCAGEGSISKEFVTSNPKIVFRDYIGINDLKSIQIDLCYSMMLASVLEFHHFLEKEFGFSVSDFGFDNFI